MSKSKEGMVTDMKTMLLQMGLEFAEAKISESRLIIHPEYAMLKISMIREAYKWIKEIYDTQYTDVRVIRRLLPAEIWVRYRNWGGFADHRECVMLHDAHVKLRKAIYKNRPAFFKKGIVNGLIKAISRAKASK